MEKLEYAIPFIRVIALSEEDVVRTSVGFEDVNAGYEWGEDWSKAFGDGN
ncbi:MAG: hypothetical protein IKZ28_01795 [Clostridia bacterium]|nr:hypothetical protein [Clostridia bacterium]